MRIYCSAIDALFECQLLSNWNILSRPAVLGKAPHPESFSMITRCLRNPKSPLVDNVAALCRAVCVVSGDRTPHFVLSEQRYDAGDLILRPRHRRRSTGSTAISPSLILGWPMSEIWSATAESRLHVTPFANDFVTCKQSFQTRNGNDLEAICVFSVK